MQNMFVPSAEPGLWDIRLRPLRRRRAPRHRRRQIVWRSLHAPVPESRQSCRQFPRAARDCLEVWSGYPASLWRRLASRVRHEQGAWSKTPPRKSVRTDGLADFPRLASQGEFHSGTERERQRGKAKGCVVMLVQDVFQAGVQLDCGIDSQAAVEIDLLVGGIQISVGQQQSVAKERVGKMCAVSAPPNQASAERERELGPDVADQEISGMWRSTKWTASDKRCGCANGNHREIRIERWRERAAGERTLNHCVQVRVAPFRGNAVAQIQFQFGFCAHGTVRA